MANTKLFTFEQIESAINSLVLEYLGDEADDSDLAYELQSGDFAGKLYAHLINPQGSQPEADVDMRFTVKNGIITKLT